MSFSIVPLKNGGYSLRSLEFGETFHPGTGPATEARILHVEQQRLIERVATHAAGGVRGESEGPFIIWDVGLGAAANAVAAIDALSLGTGAGVKDFPVEIHSFDRTIAPLEFTLSHPTELSYLVPHAERVLELMGRGNTRFGSSGRWIFHTGDFRSTMMREGLPAPHAIFYDPYSPTGNGDMWDLAHFTRLYSFLREPCLWTNYTRSTAVRVTLLLAGFYVGVGSGIGEKEETTIASNRLDMIENPLGNDWLVKIRASGNAAPFRSSEYSQAPISEEDFAVLANHPQFHFFL